MMTRRKQARLRRRINKYARRPHDMLTAAASRAASWRLWAQDGLFRVFIEGGDVNRAVRICIYKHNQRANAAWRETERQPQSVETNVPYQLEGNNYEP